MVIVSMMTIISMIILALAVTSGGLMIVILGTMMVARVLY